ncbi:MAG: nitrogenase component 1 [Dehalobacterium sp.]
MRNGLENIRPDGFSGALFALEGIRDALVILNGPAGCKFYHGALSDAQFTREASLDPLNYPESFYFGQPRIPCTYLDIYDYLYGSGEKLKKALQAVVKDKHKLVAVVNSPGAALIGDDLELYLKNQASDCPCLALESTGFSGTYSEGFQKAVINVLEKLDVPVAQKVLPNTVNLIGFSLYDKYYRGSIRELKRLLELCNIEVLSVFCAGDSVREISRFPKAAYNVVVFPEFGKEIARWMEEKYWIPFIVSPEGAPVGFDATECFIETVSEHFKVDSVPARYEVEKARARCYLHLSRFNSVTGLPGRARFSLKAHPAMAYALTKWLCRYLNMIPVAIEVEDSDNSYLTKRLYSFLMETGFAAAAKNSVAATDTDLVFADGNTIAQLQLNKISCTGIEISLPSLGYLDVMEKTHLGVEGALLLVEQILNGLQFLR